jgi:rSAM/selenodomain-associated transferase 1
VTAGAGPPSQTVVVLAKAPVAGRSKTRLTPPYLPVQAALLARAALLDTLESVHSWAQGGPRRRAVLALDGDRSALGEVELTSFAVVRQREGDHATRIAGAVLDASEIDERPGPVVLVGMDTPQLTPTDLGRAHELLARHDAVLAPAQDGGWWLLGLTADWVPAVGELLDGVPTSTDRTGALQRSRLQESGLTVASLRMLRDVDLAADVPAVSVACHPGSRFATAALTVIATPAENAPKEQAS